MPQRSGVGYVPNPAVSVAGGGSHPMDLTAHPSQFDSGSPQMQAAMFRRYGPLWQAGVSGIVHQPSIQQYFEQDFEATVASGIAPRWASPGWKAQDWTGIPTAEEVDDAYYTKDSRVTTRQVPRPPIDPPPPPPPPDPGPQPTGLSSVAQRAGELEILIFEAYSPAKIAVTPEWLDGVFEVARRTGLLRAALKAVVQIKRKYLGEPTS